MPSRTNRHSVGRKQGGSGEVAPADLEYRRQLAVQRYLDGDPMERICQEMGCSKSWLYKWKNRYQAAEPPWSQEFSRRPKTTPARTPEAIEAAISDLRRTLAPEGSEPASARGIRAPLCQHPIASLPSLRTISRSLNRQSQEGPFSSIPIDARTALLAPPHLER